MSDPKLSPPELDVQTSAPGSQGQTPALSSLGADCKRAIFAGVLGGLAGAILDFQFAVVQAARTPGRWASALAASALALTVSTVLGALFALSFVIAKHLIIATEPHLSLSGRFRTRTEYRSLLVSAFATLVGFSASILMGVRLLSSIPTPLLRLVYLSLVTLAIASVWSLAAVCIYRIVHKSGGLFRFAIASLLLLLFATWWIWGLLMIRFALAAEVMLIVASMAYLRSYWRIWRIRLGVLALAVVAVASLPWTLTDPAIELLYLSKSLPSFVLRFLPAHSRGAGVQRIRSAIADRIGHPVTWYDGSFQHFPGPSTTSSTLPDILLITIDALRADRVAAPSGRTSLTPNLDSLARLALVFRRAYASAPATVGSISQLMTGLLWQQIPHLPASFGSIAQITPGTPTLASKLSAVGYSTTAVLPQSVLTPCPYLAQGFEHVLTGDWGRARDLDTVGQVSRIVELYNSERQQPVFLWTHCMETHGHASFNGLDLAGYNESVRRVDQVIGRLLTAIISGPRWKDTVLIITADHGEGLGEGGVTFHAIARAAVLSVPLIVRIPGVAHRENYTAVGTHDIHATILSQAGLPNDARDGKDLLLISNEAEDKGRIVYHSYVVATTPQQVYEVGATRYPWQFIYEFRDDFRMLRNLERDPFGSVNLAGQGIAAEDELIEATIKSLQP
jgi:Sulfatase